VRFEELGQLKKLNDLIGNRTRDLPACSIEPQTIALCIDMKHADHFTNLTFRYFDSIKRVEKKWDDLASGYNTFRFPAYSDDIS
jgi:hypothetical protein